MEMKNFSHDVLTVLCHITSLYQPHLSAIYIMVASL